VLSEGAVLDGRRVLDEGAAPQRTFDELTRGELDMHAPMPRRAGGFGHERVNAPRRLAHVGRVEDEYAVQVAQVSRIPSMERDG
jgi:hypothetical protein